MLLSLIFFLLLLPTFQPATCSQSFIYTTFNPTNLTLNGIANITDTNILQLTNISRHIIGRGFYPNPIRFKHPDTKTSLSFSTAFIFSIVPQWRRLGGHGFAFTVSPTKDFIGAQASEYLGLMNITSINYNHNLSNNHIFAVEFDTVQDLEVLDINDNHVGVNINRMISVNSTPAGFFTDGNSTKQDLCLHNGSKIQAWVDYDGDRHQLDVTLSLYSDKPSTPIISIPLDLTPVFQDFMYVGFSSSTGVLASNHYVHGWSFNMTGKAQSLQIDQIPSPPAAPLIENSKKGGFSYKLLVVFISFLAVFVIIGVMCVVKKHLKTKPVQSWEDDIGPHSFSYKELKEATKGFQEDMLIGFGGSGKVYKGVLPHSKREIAVKRISSQSKKGEKEFLSEVSTVGRLRHRNLVHLLGWSRNEADFFLVYEFMANGSLDKYIHSDDDDDDDAAGINEPKMILSWDQRFKVIKHVSNGLLYLHEGWEQTVVHRDVKAGNVLLDSDMNAKLGDFGLAKLYEHGSNPTTTGVVGTMGYLPPEVTRTGKPTTSTDVYAFGALLLEVVCGRRPIENKALPEELFLVSWVWDKWREGCLLEVVDSRLKGVFNEAQVTLVLKVGLMCSRDDPSSRPGMKQVIRYLEGETPLPENIGGPAGNGGAVVHIVEHPPSLVKLRSL